MASFRFGDGPAEIRAKGASKNAVTLRARTVANAMRPQMFTRESQFLIAARVVTFRYCPGRGLAVYRFRDRVRLVGTVRGMVELFVFWGLFGAALGAVLASFGCVVSERRARKLSILGRSACACGRQLTVLENVPIFGWLRAGGVSGCCGGKLPVRYLLAEIFGALGGGLIGVVAAMAVSADDVSGWAILILVVLGFGGLLGIVVVGTKPGGPQE